MNGSKMEIHLFSRLASIISLFTSIIGFMPGKTRSLSLSFSLTLSSYVYLCAQFAQKTKRKWFGQNPFQVWFVAIYSDLAKNCMKPNQSIETCI